MIRPARRSETLGPKGIVARDCEATNLIVDSLSNGQLGRPGNKSVTVVTGMVCGRPDRRRVTTVLQNGWLAVLIRITVLYAASCSH